MAVLASRGDRGGRRRGPRFTGISTDETARKIQLAAVRLVTDRGLEALSLRTLAESPDLDVTRSAPLHYFGSTLGLLGAIAAYAFEELTALARARRQGGWTSAVHEVVDDTEARARELDQRVRGMADHTSWWGSEPRSPGESVVQLVLSYAQFGLERPHLYRAMHAAWLWTSVGQHGRRQGAMSERTRAKAQPWMQRALVARGAAFNELVLAVRDAQEAGELRAGPPDEVAHVFTAVVDGYLFQSFEDQVGAGQSTAHRLAYLKRLLELTMQGLAVQPRGV